MKQSVFRCFNLNDTHVCFVLRRRRSTATSSGSSVTSFIITNPIFSLNLNEILCLLSSVITANKCTNAHIYIYTFCLNTFYLLIFTRLCCIYYKYHICFICSLLYSIPSSHYCVFHVSFLPSKSNQYLQPQQM